MKIEVNITKKYFFILLGVIILVGGGVLVFAAVGDPAPNPGHRASDLAGFPDCGDNQYLKHDNGVWSCEIQTIEIQTITVDTIGCTTTKISPDNNGDTIDCAPGKVVTKIFSDTDWWGASDHHTLEITCCKLSIG